MTKDEALKLALSTLNEVRQETFRLMRNGQTLYAEDKVWSTIISIKEALAKEQEPVAYGMWDTMIGYGSRMMSVRLDKGQDGCTIPLYTTPPQRTWVGLTDDDRILIKHDANYKQFMTAGEYADIVQQLTEARLKDLNT